MWSLKEKNTAHKKKNSLCVTRRNKRVIWTEKSRGEFADVAQDSSYILVSKSIENSFYSKDVRLDFT